MNKPLFSLALLAGLVILVTSLGSPVIASAESSSAPAAKVAEADSSSASALPGPFFLKCNLLDGTACGDNLGLMQYCAAPPDWDLGQCTCQVTGTWSCVWPL